MARIRTAGRLLLLAALVAAAAAWAADVPRLAGRVNDYAGMLGASALRSLEDRLADFEAKTTNQVVVLTILSLEGEDLEGFSIRVAEAWKIGQKGKDNGVILLVAKRERKIRIEVGYGLEGVLTDLESKRIIDYAIAPRFRAGDFAGGITDGVEAIMQATEGEYTAPPGSGGRSSDAGERSAASIFFTLFFLFIVVFTRAGRFFWPGLFLFGGGRGTSGRSGGGFSGGGFSGGGGGFGGGGASGGW